MRTVAILAVILAFIAVAYAACDASGSTKCGTAYTDCATSSGATVCKCYGTLIGCLADEGCVYVIYVGSITLERDLLRLSGSRLSAVYECPLRKMVLHSLRMIQRL
jgi:hypothetical protein